MILKILLLFSLVSMIAQGQEPEIESSEITADVCSTWNKQIDSWKPKSKLWSEFALPESKVGEAVDILDLFAPKVLIEASDTPNYLAAVTRTCASGRLNVTRALIGTAVRTDVDSDIRRRVRARLREEMLFRRYPTMLNVLVNIYLMQDLIDRNLADLPGDSRTILKALQDKSKVRSKDFTDQFTKIFNRLQKEAPHYTPDEFKALTGKPLYAEFRNLVSEETDIASRYQKEFSKLADKLKVRQ